jgi:hypothetical protein
VAFTPAASAAFTALMVSMTDPDGAAISNAALLSQQRPLNGRTRARRALPMAVQRVCRAGPVTADFVGNLATPDCPAVITVVKHTTVCFAVQDLSAIYSKLAAMSRPEQRRQRPANEPPGVRRPARRGAATPSPRAGAGKRGPLERVRSRARSTALTECCLNEPPNSPCLLLVLRRRRGSGCQPSCF